MPKTKTPLSVPDQLRQHAGRATGTRWQDAMDDLAQLEEAKTAAEEAAEALDEFDTIYDALTRIQEALGTLVEYSLAPTEVLDHVNEAIASVEAANGIVSTDDLRSFAENYDEAQQALETYGDTKEGDRYDGKREDLESQWEEATGALENTAEAYEALYVSETDESPTAPSGGLSEPPGTTRVTMSAQGDLHPLSEPDKVQP